jgi:hypothetical protein
MLDIEVMHCIYCTLFPMSILFLVFQNPSEKKRTSTKVIHETIYLHSSHLL